MCWLELYGLVALITAIFYKKTTIKNLFYCLVYFGNDIEYLSATNFSCSYLVSLAKQDLL
jgi:hypothetical protein